MSKVTIKKVFRTEQETKFGVKPKVALKIEEPVVTTVAGQEVPTNDSWLSTLNVSGTEDWKDGDVVDIAIEERNGFLNFKPTQKTLEDRVKRLEDLVIGGRTEAETPQTPAQDDEEVEW